MKRADDYLLREAAAPVGNAQAGALLPPLQRLLRIATVHFQMPLAWMVRCEDKQIVAQGFHSAQAPFPPVFYDTLLQSRAGRYIADLRQLPEADDARPSGANNILSYAAEPMLDPDGRPLGVLLVADYKCHTFSTRDRAFLSELSACAADLLLAAAAPALDTDTRAELQKLALVASRTEDAVIITDAEGAIEWVNQGFTRISGYGLDEVVGKSPGELLQGPDTDPASVAYMGEQVRAGQGFRIEIINYTKQGAKYWLDIEVQPVRDSRGEIINFIAIERDITERKRANEELRRVHYTLDNINDMIFMFDARTLRFLYFNKGAIASMGYSRDELMQMTPYHIDPGFTEAEFRAMIQPLLRGERESLHFETVHRHKGGRVFPVEIFIQLVRDDSSEARFVAIVRDISERKQAEQAMQQYTRTLERLHAITTAADLDLAAKVQALLTLGREVFQLPLAIVSHIQDQRYTVEYIAGPAEAPPPGTVFDLGETYCVHTLQANQPTGFHHAGESRIRSHPCYQNFKLESYLGTAVMVGQQPYGTLNFSGPQPRPEPFSDFHYSLIQLFAQWLGSQLQQHFTNQALQRETALRRAILDSANLSIISTTVDGVITIFNKRAEALLGYRAEEVVGKATPAIIHDAGEVQCRAAELSQELGQVIAPGFEVFVAKARSGLADEQEWTYIRKDGSRFPVLLSVTALYDAQGGISGFLGVGSDITERKKVERMKQEFVSTVSHELRTPLTSIRGALGLVLGGAVGPLVEEARTMLAMAERNCERLSTLINDLLDLEKMEAGRMEFHFETLDLVQLAHSAIEVNRDYARQHQVGLALHQAPAQAMISADAGRLLQVFANLISNAVKFSPAGGQVALEIGPHSGCYRVAVIDQGPGIPAEFRERIFQRFAQADSSDTREKGGTGLGLSISKLIVERHGGRIGFDSSHGQGTCFYFELPPL